jgi:hypothetical protein
MLPTQKSVKANTKYLLLCMVSFFSSVFIFLTTANGFSWEFFFILSGIMIVLSIFILMSTTINLDTADFLSKQNAPSIFSKDNLLRKMLENSQARQDSDTDKENK